MFKKWHKLVLVAFLVIATLYFFINLGITCYFLTKPHNWQSSTPINLIGGVIFFSLFPLLSVVFSLKRFRYRSLVFSSLSLFFLVAMFLIKDSIYWAYIKEISEASVSYLCLPLVDKVFITSKVVAYPLLGLSSLIILLVSLFKKSYYLSRPVKPV